MQTPVFLDHLPDASSVSGRKSERYRHIRNKALIELLMDEDVAWVERDCPACGAPATESQTFGQVFMPFQRCSGCNTIYARRVPDQPVLDRLRAAHPAARSEGATEDEDSQAREFEFISILNWISLSDGRGDRRLRKVLDYRYSSHAPDWEAAVGRLSQSRSWQFLPLDADAAGADFADLAAALKADAPDVVLIQAEMDRVAHPEKLLATIKANAPKGTLVFIASSCADGLEYELLGAGSPSFIPLDRLAVFSISGLRSMAERLGYTVREVSTPGRRDAVILDQHFRQAANTNVPFWSGFFRDADRNRLYDLQILLQRSLRSGLLRFVIQT